jgi:hypothetical protein
MPFFRKKKAGVRPLRQKSANDYEFDETIDAFGRIVKYEGSRVVRVMLDVTLMSKPVLAMYDLTNTIKTHEMCVKVRGVTQSLHGSKDSRKPKFETNNWCIIRDGSLYMTLGSGDAHKLMPTSVLISAEALDTAYDFDYGDNPIVEGSDEDADDKSVSEKEFDIDTI